MKIGYLVEGSTDRAVIQGLQRRLCPGAALVEGHFRGSLKGGGRRRELRLACLELSTKGVDVIIDLSDANELTWGKRRDQERSWVPPEHAHKLVVGAPAPNIGAWLVADRGHFERQTHTPCRYQTDELKPFTQQAFGITGIEKQEERIADFVSAADVGVWEREDNSFGCLLEECRLKAQHLHCVLSL